MAVHTEVAAMSARYLIGLIIIILGVGFIISEVLGLDYGMLLAHWWPAFIILIGANQLARHPGRPWDAAITMLIGVLLLANTLLTLPASFWHYFWAVVLVLFGLWIVWPRKRRQSDRTVDAATIKANDRVDETIIVGTMRIHSDSASFRGGQVSVTGGYIDVDLRNAALAPEGAVLELSAFAGSIIVQVPESWPVAVSGMPLLGSCRNLARNAGVGQPGLKVNCSGLLGRIEVQN